MNIIELIVFAALLAYATFAIITIVGARDGYKNLNQNYIDQIPSMFTTIGILGTFLGIAHGLLKFDTSNIEASIPNLLDGLKTAFYASIIGILLSFIFSKIIASLKFKHEHGVLSEETQAINKLIEAIKELRNDFASTDENGNVIKPGNLFRDLYKESQKQSTALQAFSTELAMNISDGFEQILNTSTEDVVAELKLVKAEIEILGNKLKDPATDMTQNIVKDLQESMSGMIQEFKSSLSGDAKQEMERLATLLGNAGGTLTDFPSKLQLMTDNLNENFRGLQDIVQQISNQTLTQSEESTNQMKLQVEDMSKILREQVGGLQTGQQTLLNEQSKNLRVSEGLLNAFNNSIERMNGLSTEVNGSISKLNQAHTELDKVITVFRNVSQEVNASSHRFGESQNVFAKHSNEFLQKNTNTVIEIQKSLDKAKVVSTDYAQKFDIIEKGLSKVFADLDTGLRGYQSTVRESLESYLGKYTEALTKTAESLAGASSKQEDILEELTEQLSILNGRKI